MGSALTTTLMSWYGLQRVAILSVTLAGKVCLQFSSPVQCLNMELRNYTLRPMF